MGAEGMKWCRPSDGRTNSCLRTPTVFSGLFVPKIRKFPARGATVWACHPMPPRAIRKEHRSVNANRKLGSTRPIRQSAAPAARHSRRSPHRPAPEGHRMHGAAPQLSSAAASAAVRRHRLRIIRCAASPHGSRRTSAGTPDGEPTSLSGIRTDQAKIKWRQALTLLHVP